MEIVCYDTYDEMLNENFKPLLFRHANILENIESFHSTSLKIWC